MGVTWGSIRWGTSRWWERVVTFTFPRPLSTDRRSLAITWTDARTIALAEDAMTAYNSELRDIVIGDDRRIERTFTGLPTGHTVTRAWLTIKRRVRDADTAALAQKVITAVISDNGQITDASSSGGSIAMYFDLMETETAAAKSNVDYYYDIQVKTDAGEVHTLAIGTVRFWDGVTRAAS